MLFKRQFINTVGATSSLYILFECQKGLFKALYRALYMGELRKNTTSTGTITKKTLVTLAGLRLLVQKYFFYELHFFHSLMKFNSSLI